MAVPALHDDKVAGRLDMVFSPRRFAPFLARQNFPSGRVAIVLDGRGVVVARNRAADEFAGKPATAGPLAHLQQRGEGSCTGRTLDGVDVIDCFSRSKACGWTVAINVPEAVFAAELKRTLVLYALGGMGLLGLGLVLANGIGRRITEPIRALVAPAVAIGHVETAAIAPATLREAIDLGQALRHAQDVLRQREQARKQAGAWLRDSQSRLQTALDVSQVGDWGLDLSSGLLRHSLRHDQCFGYSDALTGWGRDDFRKCMHPADFEPVRLRVPEAIRNDSTWKLDCRVVWPDGSVHWIASQGVSQSGERRAAVHRGLRDRHH